MFQPTQLDLVTVEVRHVVHFRWFDHHAVRPTDKTYLAFGKGDTNFSRTSSLCPRTSTTWLRCGRPSVPRVPSSPTKCRGRRRPSRLPQGPTARTTVCERATRSRWGSSATGRPEAICGSSRGGSSTSRKGSWQQGSTHTEIRRHGSSLTQRNSGPSMCPLPSGGVRNRARTGPSRANIWRYAVSEFTARGRQRAPAQGVEIS